MLMVSYAFSEECVKYEIEDDFDISFTNDVSICEGTTTWIVGYYEDTNITGHHEESTTFISPQETRSCTSSLTFSMTAGAIVEVNMYMEAMDDTDQITVLVNQVVSGGTDSVVGTGGNSPLLTTFQPGWYAMRLTLGGAGTYDGYVSIVIY